MSPFPKRHTGEDPFSNNILLPFPAEAGFSNYTREEVEGGKKVWLDGIDDLEKDRRL